MFVVAMLSAQTPIGGIINTYARVTAMQTVDCRSYVTLDTAAGFGSGDRILLMQMKGPYVSGTYATQTVGLTEYAVIDTIIGTTITTVHPLIHTYDVTGAVQCIRVPVYDDAVATMNVVGKPWDGRTGGVIACDVRNSLMLQADIVADGIGFRGGRRWNGSVGCSTLVADGVENSPATAMKGETYVDAIPTQVSGMAPLFTGGGGGCDHNAGGGGGGNGGVGGIGGAQYEGCGRYFDNGGRGGLSVQPIVNGYPRLMLGGGGGAGHTNNSVGTGGGNGGGIVIVRCPSIIGLTRRITASGTAAPDAGNDGAGGGGGGGTVYLSTTQIQRGLTVLASGGTGGNVRTGAIHGNGAGGAGGVFLFSGAGIGGGLSYAVPGGVNGLNVQRTAEVERINRATRGSDGQAALNVVIPENVGQIPNLAVTAPRDTTVCPGTPLSLRALAQGSYARVQWIRSDGRVVSTTLTYGFVSAETQRLVIRLTDERGCAREDTCTITVDRGWALEFPPIKRTAPGCSQRIEDALWLTNNSSKPATVRAVRSRSPNAAVTLAVPIEIGPGEKLRIPIGIDLPPTQTSLSFDVEADVEPCDTTLVTSFGVTRGEASFDVAPSTVTLEPLLACLSGSIDTTVRFTFSGGGLRVTEILAEGDVNSLTSVPFTPIDSIATAISIRWRPTQPRGTGRLGFVGQIDACIDTMWVAFDGPVLRPRIQLVEPPAPPPFVVCRDTAVVLTAELIASDSARWSVDSVWTDGPGSCSLVSGMSFTDRQTVVYRVVPTGAGPYSATVNIRLMPCDTVVSFRVNGIATNIAATGTDMLTFDEPVIGRRQVLRATYRNTGTAPLRIAAVSDPASPYGIAAIDPPLPAVLQPDGILTVEVAIVQRVGTFVDSITVTIDTPCPQRLVTVLSSTASAQTYLMMPHLRGAVDVVTQMPVILLTPPLVDSTVPTDYALRLRCAAADCLIESGRDSLAAWTVSREEDDLVVVLTGRWNRGDTLAQLPILPLLSRVDSIPLRFDRSSQSIWNAFESSATYDDGSIVVDDVCSSRRKRLVRLDAKPRVSVWPQPARDHITLTLSDDGLHSVSATSIDLLGRTALIAQSSVQRNMRIPIDGLADGLYTLVIVIDAVATQHMLLVLRDR